MSYHYYRPPETRRINSDHEQDIVRTPQITLTTNESNTLQEGQEDSLMKLVEDDEQGKLLVKLLLTASQYPSADQVTRLKMQYHLMQTMHKLIKEIEQDMASYREMGNEFKVIADDFRIQLSRTQTEASKFLNRLLTVNTQLELIIDELYDFSKPTVSVNRDDEINLCMEVIKDLAGLDKFGEASAQGFHQISNSINTFKVEHVDPAKAKAIQRYEHAEKLKGTLLTTGGALGIAGGVGAGAALASPILGGAGALVIGSVAFPPAAIALGAVAIGFIGVGSLVYGIRRFLRKYHKYQTTVIKNLDYLARLCDQMKSEAVGMIEYSNKISKDADVLLVKLRIVKLSLKSEKQRQKHAQIFNHVKNANQTLIETLKSVIAFDAKSLRELDYHMLDNDRQAINQ